VTGDRLVRKIQLKPARGNPRPAETLIDGCRASGSCWLAVGKGERTTGEGERTAGDGKAGAMTPK